MQMLSYICHIKEGQNLPMGYQKLEEAKKDSSTGFRRRRALLIYLEFPAAKTMRQ
jgi:hypothetical protein